MLTVDRLSARTQSTGEPAEGGRALPQVSRSDSLFLPLIGIDEIIRDNLEV